MNLAETAQLLTIMHNVDNRRVDEATVLVWQQILAEFSFDDCLAAVIRHFRDSTTYLMPVHIADGARDVARARIRAERERLAIEQAPPTDSRPLTDRSDEIRAAVDAVREILPEGDADLLRYGRKHWRQHAERRKRQETAVPNPFYDPQAITKLAEMDAENP